MGVGKPKTRAPPPANGRPRIAGPAKAALLGSFPDPVALCARHTRTSPSHPRRLSTVTRFPGATVTRLHTPFELPVELDRAWPTTLSAADLHAGDERLLTPSRHAQWQELARGTTLSKAEHRRWDQAFMDGYSAILDGTAPYGTTDEAAAHLQLNGALTHDQRPLRTPDIRVHDDVIADSCEDWMPDVTLFAAERVYGPYGIGCGRRRLRTALSILCFSPLIPPSVRPVTRVCRSSPKPSTALRGALMSVLRAPMMLWTVDEHGVVTPMLPLGDRFLPTGPVDGLPPGAAVLGRAVPHRDGTWLACGLGLSVCPPVDNLMPRLMLELQRIRRHELRYTWEDLLRDRGELLVRSCCEWLWLHDQPCPEVR